MPKLKRACGKRGDSISCLESDYEHCQCDEGDFAHTSTLSRRDLRMCRDTWQLGFPACGGKRVSVPAEITAEKLPGIQPKVYSSDGGQQRKSQ